MNDRITIHYKNSNGETLMDNLTRDDAVDLYLMLAEQLYAVPPDVPSKSGASNMVYHVSQ